MPNLTTNRINSWQPILDHHKWHRFRYCQAWYQRDFNGRVWIKSYETIVAVIHNDGTLEKRDWYSTTTSRHISQIYKQYQAGKLC